jgi:hypothetical protein
MSFTFAPKDFMHQKYKDVLNQYSLEDQIKLVDMALQIGEEAKKRDSRTNVPYHICLDMAIDKLFSSIGKSPV